MPYDHKAQGIHVRGAAGYVDGQLCLLTVQIWPLPAEEMLELNSFIGAAVASYLEKRGLASGDYTDLTAKGVPQ